jgi:hypothetical protein
MFQKPARGVIQQSTTDGLGRFKARRGSVKENLRDGVPRPCAHTAVPISLHVHVQQQIVLGHLRGVGGL